MKTDAFVSVMRVQCLGFSHSHVSDVKSSISFHFYRPIHLSQSAYILFPFSKIIGSKTFSHWIGHQCRSLSHRQSALFSVKKKEKNSAAHEHANPFKSPIWPVWPAHQRQLEVCFSIMIFVIPWVDPETSAKKVFSLQRKKIPTDHNTSGHSEKHALFPFHFPPDQTKMKKYEIEKEIESTETFFCSFQYFLSLPSKSFGLEGSVAISRSSQKFDHFRTV